jgi:hypothetical protein
MKPVTELLQQGKKSEIWAKYCGFLDLDISEFMKIQYELLNHQIESLANSKMGKTILGNKVPKDAGEFRKIVPLTTYNDYIKYLLDKREDGLPEKPYTWLRTSGRSGEYKFKWIPYTRKMYDMCGEGGFACFILSSSKYKGHISLKKGDKGLYTVAPPPYMSGVMLQTCYDLFDFELFPSPEEAVKMDFMERIQEGMKSALTEGLDYFYGITSILLRISDQLAQSDKSERSEEMKKLLKNPKVILRLLRAMVKAKMNGRKIYPKDLWKVKGLFCAGTDTSIFKEKVKELWGRFPMEAYGSTEFGSIALQSWNTEGLIFLPRNSFYEFIPGKDYYTMKEDPNYKPSMLTLDEVKPNEEYVFVGTNFYGGILTRYISGDLIKIISLKDEDAGLKLPQMVFCTRADNIIDIGGFTRLTEKIIWRAIEDSKIEYTEWTARKEYDAKKPILHLYIELKNGNYKKQDLEVNIHNSLKQIDEPYSELESMAGVKPLRVSIFSKGTFRRYFEERQAAGADLGHLKPPHINPSDTIITSLNRMSSWQL